MSDQTQQDADLSLFGDSTPADGVTEPTANTNSDSTSPNLGAINREKQVKTWSDRIESGEATLESLPQNLGWLKPLVQDEVAKRTRTQDVDALVEAKLAEREARQRQQAEAQRFETLKSEVATLELEDTDKQILETSFKRLVTRGLSKADALEEAMSTFKVIAKSGEIAKTELKKAMNIPTVNKQVKDSIPEVGSPEFAKWGDSKSRVEQMEKIRLQGGMK